MLRSPRARALVRRARPRRARRMPHAARARARARPLRAHSLAARARARQRARARASAPRARSLVKRACACHAVARRSKTERDLPSVRARLSLAACASAEWAALGAPPARPLEFDLAAAATQIALPGRADYVLLRLGSFALAEVQALTTTLEPPTLDAPRVTPMEGVWGVGGPGCSDVCLQI